MINNNLNIPRKVNQTTQVSDYTHIFLGIPRFTPSTRLSTRPPTPRLIESPSMPRSSMRRHTPWLVESPTSPMWQGVSSEHEQIVTTQKRNTKRLRIKRTLDILIQFFLGGDETPHRQRCRCEHSRTPLHLNLACENNNAEEEEKVFKLLYAQNPHAFPSATSLFVPPTAATLIKRQVTRRSSDNGNEVPLRLLPADKPLHRVISAHFGC